jgi:hypothetical protein
MARKARTQYAILGLLCWKPHESKSNNPRYSIIDKQAGRQNMRKSNLKLKVSTIVIITCVVFATVPLQGAQHSATPAERIDKVIKDSTDDLIKLRRDLHSHPEVAGEEMRTAKVITEYLEALGLEVRSGVGGHGVVGVLRGGHPGPVVAYRADMDALASADPDPAPFASKYPGVRHVCGHDIHVTVGLGIPKALSDLRYYLSGTVKFFYQPA